MLRSRAHAPLIHVGRSEHQQSTASAPGPEAQLSKQIGHDHPYPSLGDTAVNVTPCRAWGTHTLAPCSPCGSKERVQVTRELSSVQRKQGPAIIVCTERPPGSKTEGPGAGVRRELRWQDGAAKNSRPLVPPPSQLALLEEGKPPWPREKGQRCDRAQWLEPRVPLSLHPPARARLPCGSPIPENAGGLRAHSRTRACTHPTLTLTHAPVPSYAHVCARTPPHVH